MVRSSPASPLACRVLGPWHSSPCPTRAAYLCTWRSPGRFQLTHVTVTGCLSYCSLDLEKTESAKGGPVCERFLFLRRLTSHQHPGSKASQEKRQHLPKCALLQASPGPHSARRGCSGSEEPSSLAPPSLAPLCRWGRSSQPASSKRVPRALLRGPQLDPWMVGLTPGAARGFTSGGMGSAHSSAVFPRRHPGYVHPSRHQAPSVPLNTPY